MSPIILSFLVDLLNTCTEPALVPKFFSFCFQFRILKGWCLGLADVVVSAVAHTFLKMACGRKR
jgi:hypothetical protein